MPAREFVDFDVRIPLNSGPVHERVGGVRRVVAQEDWQDQQSTTLAKQPKGLSNKFGIRTAFEMFEGAMENDPIYGL